jgi:hypothetical protein
LPVECADLNEEQLGFAQDEQREQLIEVDSQTGLWFLEQRRWTLYELTPACVKRRLEQTAKSQLSRPSDLRLIAPARWRESDSIDRDRPSAGDLRRR